uniref:Uncharacterized protein n=1 Tax=Opuntia streptacantha TaxID=393608 RepID=A0A7C9F255_OPUST
MALVSLLRHLRQDFPLVHYDVVCRRRSEGIFPTIVAAGDVDFGGPHRRASEEGPLLRHRRPIFPSPFQQIKNQNSRNGLKREWVPPAEHHHLPGFRNRRTLCKSGNRESQSPPLAAAEVEDVEIVQRRPGGVFSNWRWLLWRRLEEKEKILGEAKVVAVVEERRVGSGGVEAM